MKKVIVAGILLLLAGGAAYAYFHRKPSDAASFRLEKVTRGDIASYVSATGTLNAVNTIKVGSQISGMVQALYADYNSVVRAGQVIARLDPSMHRAQLDQAKANLSNAIAMEGTARSSLQTARANVDMAQASLRQAEVNLELNRVAQERARSELATAKANLEKAQANLEEAERTKRRKDALLAKGLIAQSEGDLARTNWESATATVAASRAQVEAAEIQLKNLSTQDKVLEAQIQGAKASLQSSQARYESARSEWEAARATVAQREAAVRLAEVNLSYCTITSPIHGIVISRDVDVGQTVAATLQSPTLFTIAQDLTQMQVDSNVSEADVGRVKEDQRVTFTVDAYPDTTFEGKVRQVRNAPIIVQNVVTYDVVVDVPNPDGRLKPGMTANVSILVASKKDCLKVPNAALRFRPDPSSKKASLEGDRPIRERPWFQRMVKGLELDAKQQERLEEITRRTAQKYLQGSTDATDEKARVQALEAMRKEIRSQIPEILNEKQRQKYQWIVRMIDEKERSQSEQGYRPGQVYILSEKGRPAPVQVRIGSSDDRYTEILSSEIREGQEVIVGTAQPGTKPQAPKTPIGMQRIPGRGM